MGEKLPQRLYALLYQMAAMHLPGRMQGLELFTVGPNSEAQDDASPAEMIQGGNLLRHHHDVAAHRGHQYAGAKFKGSGLGREIGIRHQRLPECGWVGELLAHVALRRHVVIAPDGVVAKLFGLLGDANQVLWRSKGHRVHHPRHASWQARTDSHLCSPPR